MRIQTLAFKNQLEHQLKSRVDSNEQKYKSRISTLEKAMVEKDREIGKFSSAVSLKLRLI